MNDKEMMMEQNLLELYQSTADRERVRLWDVPTSSVHFLCELPSSFPPCMWYVVWNTHTAEDGLSTGCSTKKKNTAFCSFLFHISEAKQLQSTKDVRCRHECITDSSNQVNIYWCCIKKKPCTNNLSRLMLGW